MAAKVSYVSKGSIAKNLSLLALAGAVLYGVIKTPGMISSFFREKTKTEQQQVYESRKNEITKLVSEEKTDEASKRIEDYLKDNTLRGGDANALKGLIKDSKKIFEQKKKEEELQKQKNEKLAKYDDLIARYSIISASNFLSEIRTSNLFDSNALSSLEVKLADINPENMLKSLETKVGEDKIATMEAFAKHYKEHPKAQEIRQRTLNTYLGVTSSYFNTETEDSKVHSFLGKFINWISQNKDILKNKDFSQFTSEGKTYARVLAAKVPTDIQIGDKVKIAAPIGRLVEWSTNKDIYFCNKTTNDIPVGCWGYVFQLNLPLYKVHFSNGTEFEFVRRELAPIAGTKSPEIYQQMQAIEELTRTKP